MKITLGKISGGWFLVVMLLFPGVAMPVEHFAVQPYGIIMADEVRSLRLFRDSSAEQIKQLALKMGGKYQRVVLHLGHKHMFQRGGFFFYTTSQRNLKIFCETLQQQHTQVLFWIMDSFGATAFEQLYREYPAIIHDSLKGIRQLKLPHDGFVVDIEWINHPTGHNQQRYVELLHSFKQQIGDKSLYAFAPVGDDRTENLRRGYDEPEMLTHLTNILAPIYVKDGGFHFVQGHIHVQLNDKRISQLKQYFRQQHYFSTISMESGLVIVRNHGHFYFVRSLRSENDPLLQAFTLQQAERGLYVDLLTYQAKKNFQLTKNDGETEPIQQGETVYFLKVKENILDAGDIIWEYFLWEQENI